MWAQYVVVARGDGWIVTQDADGRLWRTTNYQPGNGGPHTVEKSQSDFDMDMEEE